MSCKESFGGSFGDTVRKRELELWSEKLLDVRALDVVGLLNLDNFEDLSTKSVYCSEKSLRMERHT